jgi:hypothetical protein
MLVEEEDLGAADLTFLQQDQVINEAQAIALLRGAERDRASMSEELVAEYEAVAAQMRGNWDPAAAAAAAQEDTPEWEGYEGAYNLDARDLVFGSEDVEQEGSAAERAAARQELRGGDDYAGDVQAWADDDDGDDEWNTGRGNADDAEVVAAPETEEAPRVAADATFVEALAACTTLACLRDAHARPRAADQFNFPHALLVGWQKSATTSLYEHLARHKQVAESAVKASPRPSVHSYLVHACFDACWAPVFSSHTTCAPRHRFPGA